jgi:hypothetical protein
MSTRKGSKVLPRRSRGFTVLRSRKRLIASPIAGHALLRYFGAWLIATKATLDVRGRGQRAIPSRNWGCKRVVVGG